MQSFQLYNGVLIPAVGLGTFRLRGDEIDRVVKYAVEKCKYQLIDTAGIYRNEAAIGNVVKELGCRADIFLTSKLSPHHQGYEEAKTAFTKSITDLQVSYLDLYLIHWPGKSGQKVENPNNESARAESWKALEELYNSGKIRAIGVSNYTIRHLEQLEKTATLLPHVVQNEYHPLLANDPVPEWCRSRGIIFQSYSTLGEGHLVKESENYPVLRRLSDKYKVSISQLLLRWSLQKGIPVVPKSTREAHLEQNIDIYHFEIHHDDISQIDQLHNGRKFCWDSANVY